MRRKGMLVGAWVLLGFCLFSSPKMVFAEWQHDQYCRYDGLWHYGTLGHCTWNSGWEPKCKNLEDCVGLVEIFYYDGMCSASNDNLHQCDLIDHHVSVPILQMLCPPGAALEKDCICGTESSGLPSDDITYKVCKAGSTPPR